VEGGTGLPEAVVGSMSSDAGAIGVEEVDLTLAVDAYVGGQGLGVCLEGGAGFQYGDGFGDVRDDEGDVLLASAFVGRGEVAVEHELDVVFAVGNAHVDPTQHRSFGAATPELAEAEEIAVELDRLLAGADEEAEVVDRVGDTRGQEELSGVAGFHAVGLGFDELDDVAVGILDFEAEVSGFCFDDAAADIHASRDEVATHLFHVVYGEGDVVEATGAGGGLRVHEFDVLVVVDLDEGCADGAVGLLQVVGLVVAEEAVPEVEGFGEVGDEVCGVGDAEDLRASNGGLREERGDDEQGREDRDRGSLQVHTGLSPFVAHRADCGELWCFCGEFTVLCEPALVVG